MWRSTEGPTASSGRAPRRSTPNSCVSWPRTQPPHSRSDQAGRAVESETREVSDAGEQTTNALRFSTPGRPTSTEDKTAMVRTLHPGAAALGLDRPERIYWRPFTVSLIKAKVRAVVKLMQQRHPETIMFGSFYIGLGDRFVDARRRVRPSS